MSAPGTGICPAELPSGRPGGTWYCTEDRGHGGSHIARGSGEPPVTWPPYVGSTAGEWNARQRIGNLAAELTRQYANQCGPMPGDPWDAEAWACEAASLLAQIAGTP